jgi:hypothetical protein
MSKTKEMHDSGLAFSIFVGALSSEGNFVLPLVWPEPETVPLNEHGAAG